MADSMWPGCVSGPRSAPTLAKLGPRPHTAGFARLPLVQNSCDELDAVDFNEAADLLEARRLGFPARELDPSLPGAGSSSYSGLPGVGQNGIDQLIQPGPMSAAPFGSAIGPVDRASRVLDEAKLRGLGVVLPDHARPHRSARPPSRQIQVPP